MTTPALGVQLYSVRNDLGRESLSTTLARLAGMGFTHVEPYDILSNTEALAAAIELNGLSAVTAHAKITELDREAIVAAALRLGISTIVVPYVNPERLETREGVERFASEINEARLFAADHGIRLGYHNHDFEFRQKVDGRSAYELLVSLLDPEVVLEVDTFWASVGGGDVFELLPRLKDRVRFLHVKNEPPDEEDLPLLGVDITGRMSEVIELSKTYVELPVVEIVVDDGDVYPVLERNAAYFLSLQSRSAL
jgi:sugar phosphate isomerase/epimerase